MDVFISWSGDRSRRAAEALKDLLELTIQRSRPWVSSEDIRVGGRWFAEIGEKLQSGSVGVFVLTRGNVTSEWMAFEAGAISKVVGKGLVCPYLLELEPTDLAGPFAQFQASRADKGETFRLLKTINGALGDAAVEVRILEKLFDNAWNDFQHKLESLPAEDAPAPARSERELLEELLELVRGLVAQVQTTTWMGRDLARTDAKRRRERALEALQNSLSSHSVPPVPGQLWSSRLSESELADVLMRAMGHTGSEPSLEELLGTDLPKREKGGD